jgi:hypothetical protein
MTRKLPSTSETGVEDLGFDRVTRGRTDRDYKKVASETTIEKTPVADEDVRQTIDERIETYGIDKAERIIIKARIVSDKG